MMYTGGAMSEAGIGMLGYSCDYTPDVYMSEAGVVLLGYWHDVHR